MNTVDAPVPFTEKNVTDGQKLCEHLMKQLMRDDPRTAVIALCLALPMATKACRMRVKHVFNLLMSFESGVEQFDKNYRAGAEIPGMVVVPK